MYQKLLHYVNKRDKSRNVILHCGLRLSLLYLCIDSTDIGSLRRRASICATCTWMKGFSKMWCAKNFSQRAKMPCYWSADTTYIENFITQKKTKTGNEIWKQWYVTLVRSGVLLSVGNILFLWTQCSSELYTNSHFVRRRRTQPVSIIFVETVPPMLFRRATGIYFYDHNKYVNKQFGKT